MPFVIGDMKAMPEKWVHPHTPSGEEVLRIYGTALNLFLQNHSKPER